MKWSLIGGVGGKALNIVDNVVEDKAKANRLKFELQRLGHTITAVFDPNALTETGFVSCFAESQEAAEILTYKRRR